MDDDDPVFIFSEWILLLLPLCALFWCIVVFTLIEWAKDLLQFLSTLQTW